MQILVEQLRFLIFLPIKPDLKNGPWKYLTYAVLISALVGVGRYWDAPSEPFPFEEPATLFDRVGLSSVVYIFVLGTFLWLLALPLRPMNWTWLSFIVFMGFCAPPALIYAIPVESFLGEREAWAANIWFVGIVSVWRVGLLYRHLRVVGQLDFLSASAVTFWPLCFIVTVLHLSSRLPAMFAMMGRFVLDDGDESVQTMNALNTFARGAFYVGLALLLVYLIQIVRRNWTSITDAREEKN